MTQSSSVAMNEEACLGLRPGGGRVCGRHSARPRVRAGSRPRAVNSKLGPVSERGSSSNTGDVQCLVGFFSSGPQIDYRLDISKRVRDAAAKGRSGAEPAVDVTVRGESQDDR